MTIKERDKLVKLWQKEVYSLAESNKIDPLMDKGGADYESVCMGWMLAHGYKPDDVYPFYQHLITVGKF